jgi:hypothetical protein
MSLEARRDRLQFRPEFRMLPQNLLEVLSRSGVLAFSAGEQFQELAVLRQRLNRKNQ